MLTSLTSSICCVSIVAWAEALGAVPGVDGNQYLSKIVQVGFDLPAASPGQIHRVLEEGIAQIHSAVTDNARDLPHAERMLAAVKPYFQSLRDVYRFLNALRSFTLGCLSTRTASMSITLMLLVSEVLRTFEPAAHDMLLEMKDVRCYPNEALVPDARTQDLRTRIDAKLGELPDNRRPQNLLLLAELLPVHRPGLRPERVRVGRRIAP